MDNFKKDCKEELKCLKKASDIIKKELSKEEEVLKSKFANVMASRREMWEESVHFSTDLDRIPEMNHYLLEVNRETRDYLRTQKQIERFNKLLKSPYFGRIDFEEDEFGDVDKIYIGLYNLIDTEEDEIIIYDWRAPISSMFYQYELGRASYKSPVGIVSGNISLKRQYKIEDSKLRYYFDSDVKINDEILQEVLSANSSPKMRNIVQTIQRDQDVIIRDVENELLIVQGVAGSGKTSVALHRIAFLLYQGLNSKLNANDVIIISPNSIFSKYISEVLPELGEENVEHITFDDIILKVLKERFSVETRQDQLENLIISQEYNKFSAIKESIEFKASEAFVIILDRLINYFEKNLINFKDVYYDGEIIETKQQIKNFFLNNKINMPIAKRLKRIEGMILNKVHPLRKKRLMKIEKIVGNVGNHILEIKSFSRLVAIKEAKNFMKYLHSFTEIDYADLYKLLFKDKRLLFRLARGIKVPDNINEIMIETLKKLEANYVSYEDSFALLYIKLKLEGYKEFEKIKQVVIDEAQDYYPIQYHIFNLMFKSSRYTVLGDFNQTLERIGDKTLYDNIEDILKKKKSVKLFMDKSYRSSLEINSFIRNILGGSQEFISFDRHEDEPRILYQENLSLLNKAIADDINKHYEKGYKSIAVICKTMKESEEIKQRLENFVQVKTIKDWNEDDEKYTLIIPSYMAKGLEFDVVILYNASAENYKSEFDRRLIYVACTRALHRLDIYYTGGKSKFLLEE
ncbi:AAA family ATPase [Clostridium bovifaecis]|uniref:AAA family ATPase n=1 Tax=Clostridium bovifaecis TaxID=2184719 RepID=A0A6I6EKM3_9CLOT|nr:AAA family ATPase [Clostridium bovifaecis]